MNKELFQPIEKNCDKQLYELIIDIILEKINLSEISVGDILPSERELARQFNVSRVPVREALKILIYLNVLEKLGDNLIVKQLKPTDMISKISFSKGLNKKDLLDLFELRGAIEVYAAGRAAFSINSGDILKIKEYLDLSYKEINNRKKSSYYAQKFHEAIVAASHNDILIELYKHLYSAIQTYQNIVHSEIENSKHAYEEHVKIYNSILHNDEATALNNMKIHLNNFRREVDNYFKD